MRMRRLKGLTILLGWFTLQCQQRVAQAQLYTFVDEPVPAPRTLKTLYAFYVFSLEEAPDKADPPFQPFVKFSNIVGKSSQTDTKSVQLSMMRFRDFWKLIDPQRFCSSTADVSKNISERIDQLLVRRPPGQTYRDVSVYSHVVEMDVTSPRDVRLPIKETGVYILVFSNCGPHMGATVSGTVMVKNAYGFLPGTEFSKLRFYGWFLVLYILIALVWMVLSLRWWKQLVMIQNCIAAVLCCGLLECFMWYQCYTSWNETGYRPMGLFVCSILFTSVKASMSYMLVLVASLGWGVTRPYLDGHVLWKIRTIAVLYLLLEFFRDTVLSFRHSHSLSLGFVFSCLLPVSLLNGAIFAWIFTALSTLLQTLKERRQTAKLAVFQKLWKILVLALVIASGLILTQIFTMSRSLTARWKHQWWFSDGGPHLLFLFVLVAIMYLWAPHKYSQRYAYTKQLEDQAHDDEEEETTEKGCAYTIDDDDIDEDCDDGDTLWDVVRGDGFDDVAATTIGNPVTAKSA